MMDSNNLENLLEEYQKNASRKAWAQKVLGNPDLYIQESNNFCAHKIAITEEIEEFVQSGILAIINYDAFERYKELSLDNKLNSILKESELTRASGKEDLEDWRDAMERGFLHFKLDLSSKDFLENIDLSYLLYNANMDSTRKANRGDIEEKIKSKKEDFVIYYYPEGRFEYHYDKKYDFVWVNFTETSFSDKHFDIRPSFQKEIFTIIKGRWVGGIASLISSYIKVDSA
nr:hypothetical protein [uncultured archaeon]